MRYPPAGPNIEEIVPQEKRDEMRRELDMLVAQFLAEGGKITHVEDFANTPKWPNSAAACEKTTLSLALACRRYDLSKERFISMAREGTVKAWMFRGELRLDRKSLHEVAYRITREER